jgi:hypothetical protein
MTAIHTHDRGLSAHEWKRVQFESEPA